MLNIQVKMFAFLFIISEETPPPSFILLFYDSLQFITIRMNKLFKFTLNSFSLIFSTKLKCFIFFKVCIPQGGKGLCTIYSGVEELLRNQSKFKNKLVNISDLPCFQTVLRNINTYFREVSESRILNFIFLNRVSYKIFRFFEKCI